MAKKSENEGSEINSSEEKIDENVNNDIANLAFMALESKVPIILWDTKDEKQKDFLFEIKNSLEFDEKKKEFTSNIVNAFQIIKRKKLEKVECQFQIKPHALNTQMKKFGIHEGDLFLITYLGEKEHPDNKTTLADFKYKAFVVSIFNKEIGKFQTKPL